MHKKYLRINQDDVDVMTSHTFSSGCMQGCTVPAFIASYPTVEAALAAHPDAQAQGQQSADRHALLNDVFGAEPDEDFLI